MALSPRDESEFKQRSAERLKKTNDPVERLRLTCLSRGAHGIRGLARYVGYRRRTIPDFLTYKSQVSTYRHQHFDTGMLRINFNIHQQIVSTKKTTKISVFPVSCES